MSILKGDTKPLPPAPGMKLSKAIEINELECTSQKLQSDPDYLAAARLGIEALKRTQKAREGFRVLDPFLLPGETPEGD